jgi:hypothetical protein
VSAQAMTETLTPAALQKASDQPLKIDSGATTPVDSSTADATLSQVQWERLSQQRDVMIKAMVAVFTWLNGGVFAFTVIAWGVGIWDKSYRIVDNNTLLELIGATVVQAGIAFLAITRFLFPSAKVDDGN